MEHGSSRLLNETWLRRELPWVPNLHTACAVAKMVTGCRTALPDLGAADWDRLKLGVFLSVGPGAVHLRDLARAFVACLCGLVANAGMHAALTW